jgi:murein DD-endopeptidase MepM/ murein hydrolase activator NlpD
MDKIIKKVTSFLICIAVGMSLLVPTIPVSAATAWPGISSSKLIKAYTISTSNNTTAYSDENLTKKKGTIYATDELWISSIKKNSKGKMIAVCSYPVSGGRKTAIIPLSVVTSATAPVEQETSRAALTTYRRAGSNTKAGSISKGDKVWKLSVSGNYTQVMYNIGSASSPTGYRIAWISTSNYNNYVKKNTTSTNSNSGKVVTDNGWQMPMKNAYCTWSSKANWSFGGYNPSKSRPSRSYHTGADMASSDGNVYAAAKGVVKYVGYDSGNGKHIILEHTLNGKTVYTLYSHLDSYASGITVGKECSKGAKLGVYGSTGAVTGRHLHFAVFTGYSPSPYGYISWFSGNKVTYGKTTFYNPIYVIENGKLPQ